MATKPLPSLDLSQLLGAATPPTPSQGSGTRAEPATPPTPSQGSGTRAEQGAGDDSLTVGEIMGLSLELTPSPAFVMVDVDDANAQGDIENFLLQNSRVPQPPSPGGPQTAPAETGISAGVGTSSHPDIHDPSPHTVRGSGNPLPAGTESTAADAPAVTATAAGGVATNAPPKKSRTRSVPKVAPDDTSPAASPALAQGVLDGEIIARQSATPAYTSRIEILDAYQYRGSVGDAPAWIDRNWVGYADTPDLVRGLEPGPCIRVPTYRGDIVVVRAGDYVVQQTMTSVAGDASGDEIRLEVWSRQDFERLFVPS